MINAAYLPLTAAKLSGDEVSLLALNLLKVHQLGVLIAPTFVIPQSFLKKVLHKDAPAQEQLMQFYHQECNGGDVTIYYSVGKNNSQIRLTNIQGDANFIQTLFEVAVVCNQQTVLIQTMPQPSFSGVAWTKDQQTKSKQHIEIWSSIGTFTDGHEQKYDRWVLDHRTNDLVEHQAVNPAAKVTIDRSILQQLTKTAVVCKRHFFADQKIYWVSKENELYITAIQSVSTETETNQNYQLATVGTSLVSGYVQGPAVLIQDKKVISRTPILIAITLTKKDLAKIKTANGIVVEKNIQDHQVLAWITHFGIPTIVNAHFATKNLHHHQEIILDASNGKVFIVPTKNQPTNGSSSQEKKPFISSNYPSQLTHSQLALAGGLVVSSNNWYTALQKHPLQLTKLERKTFQSVLYEEVLSADQHFPNQWMYLLSHFDSNDRRQLTYGESYEEPEANPGLGNRGTSYLLKNSALLDLEMESLSFAYKKLTAAHQYYALQLILPFVSCVEDAIFLQTVIREKYPSITTKIWLHITSLHCLHEVLTVTHWHPDGIVLDLDYLISSWHGIDPQSQTALTSTQYLHSSFWPELKKMLTGSSLPLRIISQRLPESLASVISALHPEVVITNMAHAAAARNS